MPAAMVCCSLPGLSVAHLKRSETPQLPFLAPSLKSTVNSSAPAWATSSLSSKLIAVITITGALGCDINSDSSAN